MPKAVVAWPSRSVPDLRDHTTLRLGGPAREWVRATTEAELVAAVAEADAAGTPVLCSAGGSNLVVADAGLRRPRRRGRHHRRQRRRRRAGDPPAAGSMVTVAAGEGWDDLVADAVERGWVGIEALSGIPGAVGATPIQNVGAYGQEVAQTIARVRVWDRTLHGVRTFAAADCHFGYRHSRFKADPGRHVVLDVTFQLAPGHARRARRLRRARPHPRRRARASAPRSPTSATRSSACARGKGMVLDAADHDTWSAGSFFTNPFLDRRPGRRAARRRPALGAARRHGEVQRRLAHRARRLRQGLRARPRASGCRCRPSTRSPSPTAAAPPPTSCCPRPRGARRRRGPLRRPAGQRARDASAAPSRRLRRSRRSTPQTSRQPGGDVAAGRLDHVGRRPRGREGHLGQPGEGASSRSWAARIVAYWPASREPKSSGSSAPSATVAPAASSWGSGTEVRSE